MGFDGLTQLRVVLSSIGVCKAWLWGKFSGLDGIEPCGLDWETVSRMELEDKCLDTMEVVCAVCGEQEIFCVGLGRRQLGCI